VSYDLRRGLISSSWRRSTISFNRASCFAESLIWNNSFPDLRLRLIKSISDSVIPWNEWVAKEEKGKKNLSPCSETRVLRWLWRELGQCCLVSRSTCLHATQLWQEAIQGIDLLWGRRVHLSFNSGRRMVEYSHFKLLIPSGISSALLDVSASDLCAIGGNGREDARQENSGGLAQLPCTNNSH
jgi:hypothetical protein